MYYVYILYSKKDKNFYIGQTNNIVDRLIRHNKGKVKSTRNRRTLELIPLEVFKTRSEAIRSEAIKREKQLKMPSAGRFKNKLRTKFDL